uniref:WLM domain-containing protein n=1 Tax=Peronospora matthiolae TaxID=2874970 RepID=A0AAV1T166_9STRA
MTTFTVTYKGQLHRLSFSDASVPTIADLLAEIERATGVSPDAQRLFQEGRRVDCSEGSILLVEMSNCRHDGAPLLLVKGASLSQISDMEAAQDAEQKKAIIRKKRPEVNILKRNKWLQARESAAGPRYRFHAIEPLPNFADKDKAREILETLANDRGILAVMAAHKWNVGALAEMPASGKVGVDPVCVLGLNQNKGQKILLRLRTDDLLGFRKLLSIKKVLFHELAHIVHSEHDGNFYQLMRQVEKECNELDWTSSGGAVTGGSRMISRDTEGSGESVANGFRLGGGVAAASRLLNSATSVPEPLGSIFGSERVLPEQRKLTVETEPATAVASGNDGTKKAELVTPDASLSQQTYATSEHPAGHDKTVDEEVAMLAMSDRERRIHDSTQRLKRHFKAVGNPSAISLLYKIVSNIIAHPADVRFRSIRKANRLFDGQVAKFPECLEFLLALGFEDQVDKLVLVREDPALLWIGRSSLEGLLSRE